jgi:hypothetical protein
MKYLLAALTAVCLVIGAIGVVHAVPLASVDAAQVGAPIVVNSALIKQIAWEALKAAWESIASSVEGPAAIMGIAAAISAFLPAAKEGTAWWWVRKAINLVALNILNARNLVDASKAKPEAKPTKVTSKASDTSATA